MHEETMEIKCGIMPLWARVDATRGTWIIFNKEDYFSHGEVLGYVTGDAWDAQRTCKMIGAGTLCSFMPELDWYDIMAHRLERALQSTPETEYVVLRESLMDDHGYRVKRRIVVSVNDEDYYILTHRWFAHLGDGSLMLDDMALTEGFMEYVSTPMRGVDEVEEMFIRYLQTR